jgi:hypothetical protein
MRRPMVPFLLAGMGFRAWLVSVPDAHVSLS